jgi:hypothetical protein
MALTKEISLDEITVTRNGTVLYREVVKIVEDGKELSSTYQRFSLPPGTDLTNVPEKVAAVCNLVWTQEVIDDFLASIPTIPAVE